MVEPEASKCMPAALHLQAVGDSKLNAERQQKWQDWHQQYKALLRAQGLSDEDRRHMQDAANPCYIPRNHILQRSIEAAEKGDYAPVSAALGLHALNICFLRWQPLSCSQTRQQSILMSKPC